MRPSIKAKILFVDDDPNVLEGYKRQLRKQFDIETAPGSVEAFGMIRKNGPYAVVVADMRMPAMNGIQFLSRVVTLAPDTVRIMLTGNADQQTAIDAINEGHIFRFLTKPCSPETMTRVLEAGLAQYRLITAEKELLEKTLIGSIGILIEVLSMTNPAEFGRVKRLRDCVREVACVLGYPNAWELEIAALLTPIGHLTIPADVILKSQAGHPLTDTEQDVLARIPESSYEMLIKIPRLETIAQIIRYSTKRFNGAGIPQDAISGEQIPLGSRVLKILTDLRDLEAGGTPRSVAVRLMRNRHGWYDNPILDAITNYYMPPSSVLAGIPKVHSTRPVRTLSPELLQALPQESSEEEYSLAISFEELVVGDILTAELHTGDGALLLPKGSVMTEPVLQKLKHFSQLKGIEEPIHVAVSDEPSQENEPA